MVDKGTYDLDDLKTLLATHISRFDTVYDPNANSRIMRYLRTRARDFQIEPPAFSKAKNKAKGKGKLLQRKVQRGLIWSPSVNGAPQSSTSK